MREVFISYRQADTSGHAGRLVDVLEARLGRGTVFRDIESIDTGTDFVHAIEKALADARVMVVLIGNTWATERGRDGVPRLHHPEDFVRLEVATALKRRLPLVPVLVEGTPMPAESALPPDLAPLTRVQAIEVSEHRWAYDTARLVEAIVRVGKLEPKGAVAATGSRGVRYGVLAALLAALLVGGWYALRPPTVPSLEGRWTLPTGSFWTVWKDGARYRIEETHYDSKQVWRRGTGAANEGETFVVELQPVFDDPARARYRLELKVAADGRLLVGTIREVVSGRQESVSLSRE